jgi:excisionase family DNA binding protein
MTTARGAVGPTRLMTINDVARVLNVHPMTVRNLVRRNELDVTWVGCSMRWTNKQVDSYIKSAANRKPEPMESRQPHADAEKVQERQRAKGRNGSG